MNRPHCYGNSLDYDDSPTSRTPCSGCSHRLDCAQEIQRISARLQAPRPSYGSPPPIPPTQPPRPIYTGATPQYQQPPSYQQHSGMNYPAPGAYDFTQPVAEQFGAYLGFSFLDTLCVELRHLVGAARNNYTTQRRK
jgi:hypothetical protein